MRTEPFSEDELSHDRFLDGRVMVSQPRAGYRAAMDPVLLAAACPAREGERVLELGCGAGQASLCLGRRVAGLALAGLELQPAYADLARRNARANDLEFEVFEGDLARMPKALRALRFDQVIANPPYYPPGQGTAATDAGRERAQREATPLADWIAAGYRRLEPGGWLTVIQAVDRLADLLAAMAAGGGALSVLPVAPRPGRDAGRVIVRARKGARTPLRLLAPFVLHGAARHDRDGEDLSPLGRAVLRDGRELPFAGQ